MATTTNFGWTTPDDTDLVKNGALAIRTLGSAIDTSALQFKGKVLLSTTTLTGASITVSSIPQTYRDLYIVIRNLLPAVDNPQVRLQVNGVTTNNYNDSSAAGAQTVTFSNASWFIGQQHDNAVAQGWAEITLPDYANTVTWKTYHARQAVNNYATSTSATFYPNWGVTNKIEAISSITIFLNNGNMTSGTMLIYGLT